MADTTIVALAVVEQADCFLVGRRRPDQTLGGLWEFPGGKVHPQETPAEAAVRECYEETDLRVAATRPLLVHQQAYPHGVVTLHFIACRIVQPAGAPRPPFRWVPRGELAQLDFPAGNRPLLDRLACPDTDGRRD